MACPVSPGCDLPDPTVPHVHCSGTWEEGRANHPPGRCHRWVLLDGTGHLTLCLAVGWRDLGDGALCPPHARF